ncbi:MULTISPECIES: sensor histidine kinase [Sorangium]|uniref:histidine kinase n=1 Tax=Sorangium cellulosum (strain So ce56) TaxID=448385 RepID=A9F6P0_SORC5|nr:HAMP domain-containing sensor histidine kinase [Sorangium cellulosum]CAN91454.1 two-component sensor histidine kinase [Sorangium cellulosum So ce56]
MAAALAEQRKRQLGILASVAHDLRNPLAALKLTVDGLRPDRPLPHEERLRSMLARIGKEAARCDRMLTDLMDIARLEGGELELRRETRDARELARDVVELYRPTATAHELGLSLPEEPVPLCCDPIRIEQVLNNLVANAIKYSPAGGAVQVTVARAGAEVSIAVSDRGVGIAADDQRRLFERYFRAPSSSGVAPGVGLGLWAALRIAEAHGGRIEVTSAEGRGSTSPCGCRPRRAGRPRRISSSRVRALVLCELSTSPPPRGPSASTQPGRAQPETDLGGRGTRPPTRPGLPHGPAYLPQDRGHLARRGRAPTSGSGSNRGVRRGQMTPKTP